MLMLVSAGLHGLVLGQIDILLSLERWQFLQSFKTIISAGLKPVIVDTASEIVRTMSVHTCRSEAGTTTSVVLDTFNNVLSNLAETARSRGKGFCNSSLIIWRCCCTGDELPLRGWVMGALKYSSNLSSGIKVTVAKGEAGCC